MAKWICPVCGYVYEGENPPAECPVCHVPGSKFTKQEGEMQLAAEHVYGVGAKSIADSDASAEDKAYMMEQLKANFDGECSEVGMYLCMAARATPKSAFTGKRLHTRRPSTPPSSRSCWARALSRT